MPKRRDAKLLQVLVRQARQNRLVYVILAEIASYFPRPRLRSQTTMSMTVPTIGGGVHHGPAPRGCLAGAQNRPAHAAALLAADGSPNL